MNEIPWYLLPFEVAWTPFKGLPADLALAGFALVAGLLLMIAYRATAPRQRLRALNERMIGAIMEIWFVRQRVTAVLSALGLLAWLNIVKMAMLWRPLLLLAGIAAYILAGLQPWLEFRPLRPGESTTVTAFGAGESQLQTTGGVRIDTPPVVLEDGSEVSWRINAVSDGAVSRHSGSGISESKVKVGSSSNLVRVNASRRDTGRLRVLYPRRSWSLAGHPMGWLWCFTIYALAGAVAASVFPAVRWYGPERLSASLGAWPRS